MNKKIIVYITAIVIALTLITVVAASFKPSINKTVILQIQKYINK